MIARIFGFEGCCAAAPGARGLDETDAESPWSLQTDEGCMPPDREWCRVTGAGPMLDGIYHELVVDTCVKEGKPVYRREAEPRKFLYFRPAAKGWNIGDDHKASMCNVRAKGDDIDAIKVWLISEGGGFKEEKRITVVRHKAESPKVDAAKSPAADEKLPASSTCSTADSVGSGEETQFAQLEMPPSDGAGAAHPISDDVGAVAGAPAVAAPAAKAEKPKPKAPAKKAAAKKLLAPVDGAAKKAVGEVSKPPLQDQKPTTEQGAPAKKGKAEKPRVSYLQKLKAERAEQDKKAESMRGMVEDMLAGKGEFAKKEGPVSAGPGGLVRMPSPYERKNTRMMMLEKFRSEYIKIKQQNAGIKGWKQPQQDSPCVTVATNQYDTKVSAGLKIEGGHQHMKRPQGVKLPKDFRKPVGQITLKKLNAYDCRSDRMLISVYGDIFDVSDRPDKYGADGPYSWMSGHDLTWGFLSGKDVPEEIDKLYDLWKMEPEDMREKKLNSVIAWVAWYEYEYATMVGRLAEYDKEPSLKGPPMEHAEEDCSIM